MSSTAEERLSRHYDGELSSEESDALRAALEDDEELRAKLDGLTHLSLLIAESHEGIDADIDSDRLFDAITAKLDEDAGADDNPMFPPEQTELEAAAMGQPREGDQDAPAVSSERPALRVVQGGATTTGGRPATPRPARARNPELDRRTGMTMAFGGIAAAAAVLFGLLGTPDDAETGAPVTHEPLVAEVAPPPGSEIEEVDFGSNTGAIFSVEGQGGEQYAVIWISDEKVEVDEEERL